MMYGEGQPIGRKGAHELRINRGYFFFFFVDWLAEIITGAVLFSTPLPRNGSWFSNELPHLFISS